MSKIIGWGHPPSHSGGESGSPSLSSATEDKSTPVFEGSTRPEPAEHPADTELPPEDSRLVTVATDASAATDFGDEAGPNPETVSEEAEGLTDAFAVIEVLDEDIVEVEANIEPDYEPASEHKRDDLDQPISKYESETDVMSEPTASSAMGERLHEPVSTGELNQKILDEIREIKLNSQTSATSGTSSDMLQADFDGLCLLIDIAQEQEDLDYFEIVRALLALQRTVTEERTVRTDSFRLLNSLIHYVREAALKE